MKSGLVALQRIYTEQSGKMMKIQIKPLIFTLGLLVSFQLFAAEKILYKWTDEKGEVHYTERAPRGVEYTKIVTHVQSGGATSNKLPVNPMNQAKEEPKKDSYGGWKDENCTIANQNLDVLRNAARIGVDDGQGGKRLMTDEEKQEKITAMEQQRDKYCAEADSK